jgi:hypothetical protein
MNAGASLSTQDRVTQQVLAQVEAIHEEPLDRNQARLHNASRYTGELEHENAQGARLAEARRSRVFTHAA